MGKQVEISMSLDTIKERLVKSLVKGGGEAHPELVARIIVENLDTTEMGLSQLLLSFMGIEERLDWVCGDECLVHPDSIRSWRFEKAEMEKRGMYHNGYIKGVIKKIDMRKKESIQFEFDGIYSMSGKMEERKIEESVAVANITRDSGLSLVRPNLASLI